MRHDENEAYGNVFKRYGSSSAFGNGKMNNIHCGSVDIALVRLKPGGKRFHVWIMIAK